MKNIDIHLTYYYCQINEISILNWFNLQKLKPPTLDGVALLLYCIITTIQIVPNLFQQIKLSSQLLIDKMG